MGQESETKAAKWVIEDGKEQEKKEKGTEDETREVLHDKQGQKFTYKDLLYKEFHRKLRLYAEDLPHGVGWGLSKTDKGIVLYIQYRGKIYARGMLVSQDVRYDMNCIDRMIQKALLVADNLSGIRDNGDGTISTKTGIVLPN